MESKLNLCEPSLLLDEAGKRLYEGAFPAGERESADNLARSIAEGRILYHRTLNEQGELLCFTMVSLAPTFSFLAYMATDPTKRSGGVGTKHLKRLLEILKERNPTQLGLFLEIEATSPRNEVISEEERKTRTRRRKFYEERIGARVLCEDVPYLTPRYGGESGKEWEGELLAVEFGEPVCLGDLTEVICEIYERFYHLPPDHQLVARVVQAFEECQHRCPLGEEAAETTPDTVVKDETGLTGETPALPSGTEPTVKENSAGGANTGGDSSLQPVETVAQDTPVRADASDAAAGSTREGPGAAPDSNQAPVSAGCCFAARWWYALVAMFIFVVYKIGSRLWSRHG